jgi:predicted phage tail protein
MPFDVAEIETMVVPPREEGAVRAVVLYDPFNPLERQFVDVEWSENKTIQEYIGELEGNWLVIVHGREIAIEDWATTCALPNDTFVLARLPAKGGGGSILKMILMIALVTVAAVVSGPAAGAIGLTGLIGATAATALVTAVIVGVGGFLINALLPDAKPRQDTPESESSPSYGLNGAKNTSAEEMPVPIVYGEFRVAGNRVNVLVENSADGLAQTYMAQYVVSEGPVESIDTFEINEQPIANFQGVEAQVRHGTIPQDPISWFDDVVVPRMDGRTITQSTLTYNTIDEVDKLRLDLVFPRGLANIDSKSGKRSNKSVSLVATARNLTTNVVYPIATERWAQSTLTGAYTNIGGKRMRVTYRVTRINQYIGSGEEATLHPDSGNYNLHFVLRDANDNILLDTWEVGNAPAPTYTYEDGSDNAQGTWGTMTSNGRDFVYEVIGNGEPHFRVDYANSESNYSFVEVVSVEVLTTEGEVVITRAERSAIRTSISTPIMPRGYYRLEIHRTTAQSTNDYVLDEVVLADVNEIITDDIGYVRSASYAIRVKLTDQLSGEPNVTVKVKGRKVRIYDSNGGYGDKTWSDNPADVVLDILLSDDWERKFSASRIDFAGFSRWRAFCAANNLKFNGVFDTNGNVWDAIMAVCRVGRGNMVVVGTKWSVVLEAPSEPVMMFGDHNIIAGSFRNEWFGRDGRANRIEAQYYDKNDRNKRKSVFATDEAALARGDAIRDSSINLFGVDNAQQALNEAELQLRINQSLVQGCRFRAYLDALGCLPGDVVLVQHTMPAWGWSSRVKSVNTVGGLHITLESPLNPPGGLFEKGPDPQQDLPEGEWRIMVARQAVMRATATVQAASGSLITVSGVHTAQADPNNPYVRRIILNGQDYRVLDVTFLATETVYSLDRPTGATPGATAQLWSTEMLHQGVINRPKEWDDTLTVVGWTQTQIEPGDQILIGRTTTLGKKFRIKRFSYANDQERELELIEYDPWVYDPSGNTPAENASELQSTALQVTGLAADVFIRATENGTVLSYAKATWIAPLNDQWGHAGSRVYISRDFSDFILHEVVPAGRYESTVEATIGETIRFKVVAFAQNGRLAPFSAAPIASVLVRPNLVPPDPPLNFTVAGGPNQVALYWDPPATGFSPSYYVVYHGDSGDFTQADPLGQTVSPFFIDAGLNGGTTHFYWVRSFSSLNVSSAPVGPLSATATFTALGEGQFPIERVDALPTGLGPTDIGRVYYLTEQDGSYPPNRLYRWNGTGWVSELTDLADIADGSIPGSKIDNIAAEQIEGQLAEDNFSQTLRPVERVATAPTTGNFQGRVIFLTANDSTSFPGTTLRANKLYRWTGSAWTSEVSATDIDSRGLDIRDDFGNVVFGNDGGISNAAYINVNGNNVFISTIASNSLTPALNYVGEYASAPNQAQLGANWLQNAMYKNTTDGKSYVLTGTPLGWVVYLADGQAFSVSIESSNGTVFRVGQSASTLLKGRLFKNGAEVTDQTPDSWFRWRRISAIPRPSPNDDATWNSNYQSGYKNVSINVDDVYARATFFCDIISP